MTIRCRRASQLVSQSMDHLLVWRQRFALWIHLFICGKCRQFMMQLRLIRATLKRMVNQGENDASVKLSDDAVKRIREMLDKVQK